MSTADQLKCVFTLFKLLKQDVFYFMNVLVNYKAKKDNWSTIPVKFKELKLLLKIF